MKTTERGHRMAIDWAPVVKQVRDIISAAVEEGRKFGPCDPNYVRAKHALSMLSDAQHLIEMGGPGSLSEASDVINRVKIMLCDVMDDHNPRDFS